MKLLSILAIATGAALLTSCSTGGGGGGRRYKYPESKIGSGGKNVRFASMDGRFVGLSDGSLWNIDWNDAKAAARMRAGEAVQVRKTGSGSFPYELSTPSGASASARYGKRLD